jgi:hypothetical protein
MADEYAVYGVPCLQPPCKVSKLKTAKDETDQGSDETAVETQFLQHKTKGNYLYKTIVNVTDGSENCDCRALHFDTVVTTVIIIIIH